MPDNELHVTPNDPAGVPLYANDGKQIDTVFIGDALLCLEDATETRSRVGVFGEMLKVRKKDGTEGYVDASKVQLATVAEPDEISTKFVWNKGHALAGIHGPADPGWGVWDDEKYLMIKNARMEAVKVMASSYLMEGNPNKPIEIVGKIREAGAKFILARLFFQFGEKRSEQQFVDEVLPCARLLYEHGVTYFEVHNEPNISHEASPEGMWVQWQDGKGFSDYYLKVLGMLRKEMREAHFGFPGVSPGPDFEHGGRKIRYDSERFMSEAAEALQASDFICMHVYWGGNETNYSVALDTVEEFCNRFPRKLVMVTEFCNDHPDTNKFPKKLRGDQYASFYAGTKKLPTNLGVSFCYLLSSSGGYEMSTWDNDVVASVGSRMVV
jgi:hypothetical protein